MKFRVLGVAAIMFWGAISIIGRAGAQTDTGAPEPKAVAPDSATEPPEAAFPPVEQAAPDTPAWGRLRNLHNWARWGLNRKTHVAALASRGDLGPQQLP